MNSMLVIQRKDGVFFSVDFHKDETTEKVLQSHSSFEEAKEYFLSFSVFGCGESIPTSFNCLDDVVQDFYNEKNGCLYLWEENVGWIYRNIFFERGKKISSVWRKLLWCKPL